MLITKRVMTKDQCDGFLDNQFILAFAMNEADTEVIRKYRPHTAHCVCCRELNENPYWAEVSAFSDRVGGVCWVFHLSAEVFLTSS